jgi:hypothetical protein
MNTIEILQLATKVAGSKDGGLSVIGEILKSKNIACMVLYLDENGNGQIKNFQENLMSTLIEQSSLINELVSEVIELRSKIN